MKQIYHFSDQLSSVDCIPCPEKNHSGRYSRDHIPTKALLNPPYSENLMDVGMCRESNSGFAKDEEYFAAFLASAISGSIEPNPQQFPTASRIPGSQCPIAQSICITVHNPTITSPIDVKKTTAWGESGFPGHISRRYKIRSRRCCTGLPSL